MCQVCDLILVRHGEALGNVAMYNSKFLGDDSGFSETLRKMPSEFWPLTLRGQRESRVAGQWLRTKVNLKKFRFIHSRHVRVQESAELILPNINWETDPLVIGRYWGGMESIPYSEHLDLCLTNGMSGLPMEFHEAYPGGEPMAAVYDRVKMFLAKFQQSAIVVTSGEVIQAFRLVLEGIPPEDYLRLEENGEHIRNGQVVWYSRRSPDSGECRDQFVYKKLFFSEFESEWCNISAKAI